MGALKLKETVASHLKMTPTNWEDHQSLSSYNYTRSCWRAHCRPFCGHLAFEANWKDKKAQSVGASWADCKSKKSLSWKVIFSYSMQQQKTISDQIVTCGSVWRKMETYITIYKIYSQWEFAVWLKELKPGLGNNLVKGCCYEWMTLGLLASGRQEFIVGPVTRLHWSELLCNKVLLKYKGDRESFWHRHQKRVERVPAC